MTKAESRYVKIGDKLYHNILNKNIIVEEIPAHNGIGDFTYRFEGTSPFRDGGGDTENWKYVDFIENENKNMLRTWNKFFESLIIPGLKLDEFVKGIEPAGKAHKNILSIYFNTYENYVDLDDPQKHIFKINDLTGDILNNGRVQFNAMVFGKQELETIIRNNIVNLAMNEFYDNLPNNINIFGIDIKPISFIHKDDLKFSFENLLPVEELERIITSVTGYSFLGERDGYYIWRKNL